MKTINRLLILSFLSALASPLTASYAIASEKTIDSQVSVQLRKIESSFKEQWAYQKMDNPYQVTDEEIHTFTSVLNSQCTEHMEKKIKDDPTLQQLKFPIQFVFEDDRGTLSREVRAGNDKYTELYHSIERTNVSAEAQLEKCQTVCDTKEVPFNGGKYRMTKQCVSKPLATLTSPTPITTKLPSLNEFVAIQGWDP